MKKVSHEEVYGDREDLDQTAIMIKKIESLKAEKHKLDTATQRNTVRIYSQFLFFIFQFLFTFSIFILIFLFNFY